MRDELSLQLAHHLLVSHDVSWLLLASASQAEMRNLHLALHAGPGGSGPKPVSGGIWQDRPSENIAPNHRAGRDQRSAQ